MSNKLFGTVLLVGAMSVGCVEYGPEPQTVAQQAPEQAPTEQQMYETLAPYGDWVETDVYGSVWCPSAGVVGVGFSPYRHGAWVYGSSGYYFNSYDSWGWLPYHYGNWVSLDVCGWGWVPGFAWGPGWVDWYWGYPYPIAPYWYGYNRPWTIARPTTIARPPVVHATVLTPRLDTATGRLYAGNATAPANARLITPPNIARAGFAGRPVSPGAMGANVHPSLAARGAASASFSGRPQPWTARPAGPYAQPRGYTPARPGAMPARPYSAPAPRSYSAPAPHSYSAPHYSAPAPHYSAPSGGGHHK